MIQAVTGSGKTLSYLIPIIETLMKIKKVHACYAVVICPTRELAAQISDVLESLLKHLNASEESISNALPNVEGTVDPAALVESAPPSNFIKHQVMTGGYLLIHDLNRYQKQGGHIIIGTPGKLESFFEKVKTPNLEVLVLDEADRLLDMGFETQIRSVLSKLPKQRRTGLFSATMTDGVHSLVKAGLRNPVHVQVKIESKFNGSIRVPESMDVTYITCKSDEKFGTLANILETCSKCIVFFNTCSSVDYFCGVSDISAFCSRFM